MFRESQTCEHARVPTRKPTPSPLRSQFGRNIAHLRAARHLTQEALAEKCGISARYVQSLEAGEYFPALPTLVGLRKALRASWEEIFDGCG